MLWLTEAVLDRSERCSEKDRISDEWIKTGRIFLLRTICLIFLRIIRCRSGRAGWEKTYPVSEIWCGWVCGSEGCKSLHRYETESILIISLVHDPQIIIFDEPTNGLDVITAKVVTDFAGIESRRKNDHCINTYFSLIEKICDRVGIIINGKWFCVTRFPMWRRKCHLRISSLKSIGKRQVR